jgi:hypothetical protein
MDDNSGLEHNSYDPLDGESIEKLRILLESDIHQSVSYLDAVAVGESLLSLFEVLADTRLTESGFES